MANLLSFRGYPTGNTRGLNPLDRTRLINRQPVVNTGGPLPPTPVITATTGGGLPPQLNPAQNPNDFLIPNLTPTVSTGGGLPPSGIGTVTTGGGLPPQVVPTVNTGGGLPPSGGVGPVNTGGGLPPQTLPPINTGGPLPPTPTGSSLPALDGSQYVAGTTPGGPGTPASITVGDLAQQFAYQPDNISGTVQQFASQFAYTPGESPISVAQRIAAQFNTTPDQLPVEIVQGINAAFQQQQRDPAAQVALDTMGTILDNENSYVRNARLRGLEQANSRGMLNSSIAAGSAERAAIEAAQPMFSEAMGLTGQREAQDFNALMQSRNQAFGLTSDREQRQFQRDMAGTEMAGQFEGMDRQALIQQAQQQFALAGQLEGQARDAALAQARDAFNAAQALSGQREQNAFMGQQAALDRTQGVNNALLGSELDQRRAILDTELRRSLQNDQTAQQDWLSDRQFDREFNAAISTMSLGNAFDLNRAVMDYANQNPEIYTPEIISGMTNFFQMNMTGLLQQYFPDLMGTNGGGE